MTAAGLARVHGMVADALRRAGRAAPPAVEVLPALASVEAEFDADEAAGFAASPWAREGWLRFRSAVVWCDAADARLMAQYGPPIAGEWCDGETSFRLMAHPSVSGRSLLVAVRALSDDAFAALAGAERARAACLVQEVRVIAAPAGGVAPPKPRMIHRVHFRLGADGALVRAFESFRGFGE